MSVLKYESQVRPPLVSGDKSYHDITVDIVRPIENRPSKLWWTGFLIAVGLLSFGIFSVTREVIYGTGQWNLNKTIGWGWGYHQFRMVGRYRACGNPDFRDSFIIPSGLENGCKPCCRSDDDFCGNVCRTVSDLAYGSCVDGLLLFTLSKYARTVVAEF